MKVSIPKKKKKLSKLDPWNDPYAGMTSSEMTTEQEEKRAERYN
jgi:hypothetical protein